VVKERKKDSSDNWREFERNPAFKGQMEFDMSVEFLGHKVTRRARVKYEHTPKWEYFDLTKKALCDDGNNHYSYQLEILAVPQEYHDDGPVTEGTPYWITLGDVTASDVLPNEMWDAVLDAIDEKCKTEDAERRQKYLISKT
jgi:hypothetical protein